MDENLAKLRAELVEDEQAEVMRKPRESQSVLAPERAQAVAEREELAREIPSARDLIAATEERLKPSEYDLLALAEKFPVAAKAIKDIADALLMGKRDL